MSEIKPIETVYNGYRFRSRLEARWAVFFNAMGIKYEYEPEGYELSTGEKYLPDFHLPEMGYYAEVKGMNNHLASDVSKMCEFVAEKKNSIIILSQVPYSEESCGLYFFPMLHFLSKHCTSIVADHGFFYYDDGRSFIQDNYYIGRELRWSPWAAKVDNNILCEELQAIPGEKVDLVDEDDDFSITIRDTHQGLAKVQSAIRAARQARFEHGECG